MVDAGAGHGSDRADPIVLQTFVWPDERRADRLGLYVRYPEGHVRLGTDRGMAVEAGGVLDLCTFFNAFSHRKWHQLTGLRDLGLRVAGSGTVELVVATYHAGGAAWPLLRAEVTLAAEPVELRLPALGSFKGEVLGLTVTPGAADAHLRSAAWVTREAPRRGVHLGAIITTFGRPAAVRRAMANFSDTICQGATLGSVSLTVVDNGGELEPSTLPGVRVVRNPNLGGAGGFSRGLIEVMDEGRCTHALLMDDDAACEPESVWRTMAVMAYAIDGHAALAGAMLLNERPCVQYEKGAALDRLGRTAKPWTTPWTVNGHMRDVSLLQEVCGNERDDPLNFGGWWFFAFALAAMETMPFPFFVRGDDVDFSLSNRLRIVTMNGVATWCDGFSTKLGAATEYLAYRAWFAVTLMHGNRRAARRMLRFILITARRFAYRFDYRAMDAVLDSVEDVMRGPQAFTGRPAPLDKLKAYRSGVRPTLGLEDFERIEPQSWTMAAKTWAKLPFAGHGLAPLSRLAKGVRHARILWDFHRLGLGGASKAVAGEGTDLQVFAFDKRLFFEGLRRIADIQKRAGTLAEVQDRYRAVAAPVRTRAYWEPLFRQGASPASQGSGAPGDGHEGDADKGDGGVAAGPTDVSRGSEPVRMLDAARE